MEKSGTAVRHPGYTNAVAPIARSLAVCAARDDKTPYDSRFSIRLSPAPESSWFHTRRRTTAPFLLGVAALLATWLPAPLRHAGQSHPGPAHRMIAKHRSVSLPFRGARDVIPWCADVFDELAAALLQNKNPHRSLTIALSAGKTSRRHGITSRAPQTLAPRARTTHRSYDPRPQIRPAPVGQKARL